MPDAFCEKAIMVLEIIDRFALNNFENHYNRIDLITEISAVNFEDAWKNREEGVLDNLKVWFIGKKDLIQNKKATGRDKDLSDVKILEKSN